jgi:hypothetical protein
MKKIIIPFLILFTISFIACNPTDVGVNIYVAGIDNSVSSIAKYWVNGIGTNLTNGTHDASTKGIFVYDGDVYVAGYEQNDSSIYVGKYWVNGVETVLDRWNT